MPDMNRLSVRVTGVTTGTVISLAGLSGGYTHRRDKGRYPEGLSPREITERLHDQIAAQSPEHAALVAEFRDKQQRGDGCDD